MKRFLAYTCFFLSGCAGLIYEIAWIRKSALIFGSTSAALSTVLAVFFGGLALGAWLFGRWGLRTTRPIRWYALLEFGLAGMALLSPVLFDAIEGLYGHMWRGALQPVTDADGLVWLTAGAGLAVVRVLLVALVLLLPTVLMGGTLPLFVRQFVVARDRLGADVARLYALNTLGAVAGTLLAGFVLLPAIGVGHSIRLAAALNVVAGALALSLPFRAEATAAADAPVPTGDTTPPALLRTMPLLFFAAGFIAIGAEVLWTRFLALIIRNSVTTYTLTLATVLLGIVLGSLLAARLADRPRTGGLGRASWYGLLQLAAAVALGTIMFLPVGWWQGLGQGLVPLAVLMLPAAVLSGSLFPLANRLVIADPARSAAAVGRMTALNTVGGIAGSLVVGFGVLPHLGLAATVRVLAAVGLVAGAWALWAAGGATGRVTRGVTMIVALVLAFGLPAAWGVRLPHAYLAPAGVLVDVAEGRGSTLAAVRAKERLLLQIDRLWQGSDQKSHQVMAAHLPALLHGAPRDVLVIGVGVGQTAGRFLMHGTERLDCVDIEPKIFPFIDRNFPTDWLRAGPVTLVPEDGRTFTAHSDRRYDVVSVEVGQVFRPGVDAFYTREFYEEARRLLKPGGVVSQFVSLAFFSDAEFDGVVRTFLDVFPHATLWYNTQELVLVGSAETVPLFDPARLDRSTLPAAVGADLRWSAWGGRDFYLDRPQVLLGSFLADGEALARITADGEIYTDDRPVLAYATANSQAWEHREVALARRLGPLLPPVERGLVPSAAVDGAFLADALRVRNLNLRDIMAAAQLDDAIAGRSGGRALLQGEVEDLLRQVVRVNPESFHGWFNLGKSLQLRGGHAGAVDPLRRASNMRPESARTRRDLGLSLYQTGQLDAALVELTVAARSLPDDFSVHNFLGAVLGAQGDYAASVRAFTRALEIRPGDESARRNLEQARRMAGSRKAKPAG